MKKLTLIFTLLFCFTASAADRPNILFCLADDWSWPHASIYGANEVETPAFDRIAKEGALFNQAFTLAPQCSPNRAATLTSRYIWQLQEAGTHGSIFPNTYPVFPQLLEEAGYHCGFTGKGWAPGSWELGGWKQNPAGKEYSRIKYKGDDRPKGVNPVDYAENFKAFLEERPDDAPFCFWYGAKEPHQVYEEGSGIASGKDPDKITVPAFLPDVPEVRSDLLDYRLEVEWFDRHLGQIVEHLRKIGELDNTLIIVSSDNGMPYPRAKANLYEFGTRVPLAIRWPEKVKQARHENALVSFIDFAPTILQAAEITVPDSMQGKSLLPLLGGDIAEADHRDYILTGRERHSHSRFDNWGYPARAIRTADHLYIWNVKPDRWPAGDPDQYYDIDNCPTKRFLLENKDHPEYKKYFELSMGKHPAHELFAMEEDIYCLNNLAEKDQDTRENLHDQLTTLLKEQGDPRLHGNGDIFESYPRFGGFRPHLGGFIKRGEYNPAYQK